MPLLVVILVACLVLGFVVVSSNRKARKAWLAKLDLPGTWHWQQGDGQLSLNGSYDRGTFVLTEADQESTGDWALEGNVLHLDSASGRQSYDLHYFKAGSIGLEDSNGERKVYSKETSNVVPLHRQ